MDTITRTVLSRSPPTDFDELLRGCAGGSPEAWRKFSERYHRLITGCSVRFGSPGHGEDIAQEVYLRLIQNDFVLLRRFAGSEAAFTIYLKNIAKNIACNCGKKTRRTADREILFDNLPETAPAGLSEFPITPMELLEEILCLKLPYRIVLHLRFMGYNHREIAGILEKPLNTVLTHSRRAVAILKSRLSVQ